ncbi:MAG: LptF/LptG family permease, partial [Brevundimonas sp.]
MFCAGIGLLSQSLDQLQLIVERGQSLGVMAKLTLLALPQLLSVILPIGLFVGALISLTRLQREQELTAIFASGVGRWSAILPAGVLAGAAAALGLLTTLVLQPWAQHEARQQAFEIRTDLAALLVEEGSFVQGPEGLTVYVQKVEQNGLLKNLFVYLDNGKTVTTWDADEARFGHADGVPVLRMGHGSMQRYSKNGVLEYFSF